MDEQFSPEYIAFMRGAGALQALWVPGAGDRYTFLGADKAYLLDYPLDPRLGGVDDDVRWLPSLFQLLRIIEKAGWRWGAEMLTERKGPGGRYTEYRIGAEREEDKDSLLCLDNWEEGDLMLAAAKLAARAVEDKG